MTFTFFDIFITIIVSQGIFLSLALYLIPKKNKSANHTLSIILLIASIMCIGRVLAFKYKSLLIIRIGTLVDGTIFIFGPLLYLYFRRLMFEERKAYKLTFYHYIVLCVFSIYAIWAINLSHNDIIINFKNGTLKKIFFLIEFTGLASLAFYAFKIHRLLRTYKKHEHAQISYNQGIINYTKRVLIIIVIFVSLWLFSFISGYGFSYYHPIINYDAMWLSSAFFIYFIGFYSLTQPEIFRIPIKFDEKKAVKNRLSQNDIDTLKLRLQKRVEFDHIYLKPNLSLNILAEQIQTSSNNLSWYLNKVENKTFYNYINEYRIHAFVKKIENNEHLTKTLLAMAFEVGFNTKSTFNKSFKAILNDTPANYIKKSSEMRPNVYK